MRQAGLNPNLVYGNGVEGNQSAAPNVGIANRGQHSDFGFAQAVQNVFRRRQIENETKVADASREKLLADSQLSQARYLDTMIDVAKKDVTFDTFVEQAKANLDHTRQAIAESQAREAKTLQEGNNLRIVAAELVERVKYWAAHAENEAQYMPALLKARTHQALESGNLSAAQIPVANSLVKLNNAKVDELMQMVLNLKIEGGLKAIEFEISDAMNDIGLTGVKPKDLLILLKQLLLDNNK